MKSQPETEPEATPRTLPPLVIAGHGTRDPQGVAVCTALVERVRGMLPGVRVEAGFVELTPPTIDEALSGVLDEGSQAVVVPLMIGTGGHVREDIPEAIEGGKLGHEGATVVYTRHLGSPKAMVSAARQRIDAAMGEWDPSETTVVFVGRGCSVAEANADHARLARIMQETGGYAQVVPAFIQVTSPTLPDALAAVCAAGARRIVVMPHYLFPGRLSTWVTQASEAFRAEHGDAEVRVADVIGDCDELASVVVQRHKEGSLHLRRDLGSPAYLSGLLLAGRKVVAAGGGCVNRRRVPALVESGALVTVIAPTLHPALQVLADEGRIAWEARDITDDDLDGAWYVLAATDNPEVNAHIAAAAEERHTFCVRADDAAQGSAWTPATGTVSGATVAVLTNHDPRRAAKLRDRVVGLLEADND